MPRVKSSVTHRARVKKVLKAAKGYYGRRKSVYSLAKQHVVRAQAFAYAHRRKKKGDFRRLWQTRINAALAEHNVKYATFIHQLKQRNILLNRKALSFLALYDKEGFSSLINFTKNSS